MIVREPETIVAPWQSAPRGARLLEQPRDVMFDIDDVLFPTMMSIHDLAYAAGYHDGTVEPRWTGWEVYKTPTGDPLPQQAYWDLWSDFALAGGYTSTPPIPEAAEALRALYYAGHRIHLVTARGFMAHADDIRRWTPEWIEEFAIPWHTLTFAQDKPAVMDTVLATSPNPGNHCKRFFDYAIDDSPKNWEALHDAGVESFLLNHPHNRDFDYDWGHPRLNETNVWRLDTVTEFVNIILEGTASE